MTERPVVEEFARVLGGTYGQAYAAIAYMSAVRSVKIQMAGNEDMLAMFEQPDIKELLAKIPDTGLVATNELKGALKAESSRLKGFESLPLQSLAQIRALHGKTIVEMSAEESIIYDTICRQFLSFKIFDGISMHFDKIEDLMSSVGLSNPEVERFYGEFLTK